MSSEVEGTHSSRQRLLDAGKLLFARHGFEHAATAAIAREAGTSELQLVRYFQSKAGLLEAIFNESWVVLNHDIQHVVVAATNAREALAGVLETVTRDFSRDPDLAHLLLFEGRRIRSASSEIRLSKGFIEFENLLRVLIHRGKRDGTIRENLQETAAASALIGATEAMIRDRLIAKRVDKESPFSDDDVRAVFFAFLDGMAGKS